MTELGYLLSKSRLQRRMREPDYFGKSYVLDDVPVYELLQRKSVGLTDLLYDSHGLGAMLEDNDCGALPAPTNKDVWPTKGERVKENILKI